jgi:outer membrane protein
MAPCGFTALRRREINLMKNIVRTQRNALALRSRILLTGAIISVSSAMAALPGVAQAQQASAKIGFVSTERIMKEANPAKAAQAKIEQDFARRDKELQDLSSRLRSATERLDKEASVLAESDRVRRQREIAEMDRDFQRRQREFREDLNARRNEELSAVLEKANRAIKEIAEREKFDLILQEAVFVSPRMDITEQVVKLLNSGSK